MALGGEKAKCVRGYFFIANFLEIKRHLKCSFHNLKNKFFVGKKKENGISEITRPELRKNRGQK